MTLSVSLVLRCSGDSRRAVQSNVMTAPYRLMKEGSSVVSGASHCDARGLDRSPEQGFARETPDQGHYPSPPHQAKLGPELHHLVQKKGAEAPKGSEQTSLRK